MPQERNFQEVLANRLQKISNVILSQVLGSFGSELTDKLDELSTKFSRPKIKIVFAADLEDFEMQKLEQNPEAEVIGEEIIRRVRKHKLWQNDIRKIIRILERDYNIQKFDHVIIYDESISTHVTQEENKDPKSSFTLSENDKRFLMSLKIDTQK